MSTILYGFLVIFFLIVTVLMSVLSTSRNSSVKLSDQIDDDLNNYNTSKEKNPNAPVLVGRMIPVVYDSIKSSWVKSDTNNWYNYSEKKWANSVIVNDDSVAKYNGISAGDVISMDDINSMWVFIPSFDVSTLRFTSDSSTGGFWVGKFELSIDKNNDCYKNSSIDTCNKDSISPLIKPDLVSWRNVGYDVVSKAISNNMVGFLKNTVNVIDFDSWNVISALSSSKYGVGSIESNGCNMYITGKGANCSINYNSDSLPFTTTGNIYGVYDMSGGALEFVSGSIVMGGNGINNKTNCDGSPNSLYGSRAIIKI